jgi:hypothetical protein
MAIRTAYQHTRQTWIALRLQPELEADGFRTGVGRIKRLLLTTNLKCRD